MKLRALSACALAACIDTTPATASPELDSHGSALTAGPSAGAAVGAVPPLEHRRLRHDLSRSAANLRVERRDGRVRVDLDGRFQSATVVFPDESGHPRRLCLDDASQLDHLLGSAR